MKRQKHYWTVEIEGLDWTKARKIWNFESAKAVCEQEKRFAKAQRLHRKLLDNPIMNVRF